MSTDHSENAPKEESGPRRRRTRYKGTHPRRFDDRYKELDPDTYPEIQHHVREQGRTPAGTHIPVLLSELLQALDPAPGDVVVDCTLGFGGHAREFAGRISPGGHFIGLDLDAAELEKTRARLEGLRTGGDIAKTEAQPSEVRLSFHRCHFAGLGKVLKAEDVAGFDIVYADLGVSSMQIDDPARGFSYKHDGPLDMRMDSRLPRTAADVIARIPIAEFRDALETLADEPDAARIAEIVERRRAAQAFTRTSQLVDAVFEAKKITRRAWRERPVEQRGRLHPAARTFQALRMIVNDEVSGLAQFLRVVPHCLRPGGRLGIISFHSGEDQMVEEALAAGLDDGTFGKISDSAIEPTPAEIAANPRSRSALLRWAIKADQRQS